MPTTTLTYEDALPRVIRVIKKKEEIPEVKAEDRLLDDLGIDSLAVVELVMALEEEFDVTFPDAGTAFFAADEPWRVSHLATLVVHLERKRYPAFAKPTVPAHETVSFTQLGGRLSIVPDRLYLASGTNREGFPLYERQMDGMRVVALPNGLWMDREPVSHLAYSRFLNSTCPDSETLHAWCGAQDFRSAFFGLDKSLHGEWHPKEGLEQLPVVLVSWYGAHAYALWAHGQDWRAWESATHGDSPCYLPTASDWLYAAQGVDLTTAVCGQHVPGNTYMPTGLPLFATNARLAVSSFGLHHMAGNIWHWCSDFYGDSREVRNERGGSWVGPVELTSPNYARGRRPNLRGRCLGFRCGHRAELI
jgi:formylglycine-generating enzyme